MVWLNHETSFVLQGLKSLRRLSETVGIGTL
ncbi:hypothetical protein EMIT043CA1_210046 [Pseudomonas brassicacearum]